jgi:LPS export ABC transporter protein LptC
MNLKKLPIILILVLAILSALVLIYGCGGEGTNNESADTSQTDGLQPDQITTNAHIILYSGGHQTTDLLADTIWQFTKYDSAVAENLFVEFFDTAGTRISTLTSEHGYIRQDDKFLAVSGSVVVIGKDSVRLETEYLEWDGDKDSVVTDSFVTIIEKSDTLMSYGFQSDPQLRDIIFKHRVSGRLTEVEKGKK